MNSAKSYLSVPLTRFCLINSLIKRKMERIV